MLLVQYIDGQFAMFRPDRLSVENAIQSEFICYIACCLRHRRPATRPEDGDVVVESSFLRQTARPANFTELKHQQKGSTIGMYRSDAAFAAAQ